MLVLRIKGVNLSTQHVIRKSLCERKSSAVCCTTGTQRANICCTTSVVEGVIFWMSRLWKIWSSQGCNYEEKGFFGRSCFLHYPLWQWRQHCPRKRILLSHYKLLHSRRAERQYDVLTSQINTTGGADKSLARPDLKNNWKVATFRPTRRSLLPRRPGWTDKLLNFFEWLAKVRVW